MPWLGFNKPNRTRSSVVLPAPFGPMTVTISPGATLMSTVSRIRCPRITTRKARPVTSASCPGADTSEGVSGGERLTIGPRAGETDTADLDDRFDHGKPHRPGAGRDCFFDDRRVHLGDRSAAPADEELARVTAPGHDAGDVRVETFDAMHEVVPLQELQGAVNQDRRRRMPFAADVPEDVIGADRGVARGDDLEDATPLRRQANVALGAALLRPRHQHCQAVPMIVIGGWENHVGGHLREAPSRGSVYA